MTAMIRPDTKDNTACAIFPAGSMGANSPVEITVEQPGRESLP